MTRTPALVLALIPCLAGTAGAQANADPAIDLRLGDLDELTVLGRRGAYPDGRLGCALRTTACNVGTVPIDWRAVMDPDHPFIASLLVYESGGRLRQFSDRSYVKHAFFALPGTFCGSCSPTDGSTLGVGCSDTYLPGTNGDNYWLGPPDEIDPWLGTWDPICSHFDRGEPPVDPPQDCNGVRSLTLSQANMLGSIGHRVEIQESDLQIPGASYWYQGMYVVAKEPEAVRGDSIGSRAFVPVWNGTRWELDASGPLVHGSVLEQWPGAVVASGTNGADDGRLYAGVKVSGPVEGFYHYEYAVHNRDNARGVSAFRIALCPSARVRAVGFSDVDGDPSDDWTALRLGDRLIVAASPTSTNTLRWNTIFNFWFDSDAAPDPGTLSLDQAAPGPGLPAVVLALPVPLLLTQVHLGRGCARATPPTLFATGDPPRASLGNATFALQSTGNAPGQPNLLLFSRTPGAFSFPPCTLWLGDGGPVQVGSCVLTDAAGVATHPVPIPSDPALEGREVGIQLLARNPGQGALFSDFELSDGLLVRVGSALAGCP